MEIVRKILIVVLLLILSGCNAQKEDDMENSKVGDFLNKLSGKEIYSTKEESIDYMNEQLEEKYSETFVIDEDSVSYDDKTYPTTIVSKGTAHSESRPEYEFDIYSRSSGVFKDSYGNYRFLEGAQQEADEFCKGRDYVDSCDATLTTDSVSDNLLEEYPTYEDYRKEHSIYYNIHLKGRNPKDYPEDYVEPMIELITDLLDGPYGNGYIVADYMDTDGYVLNIWWEVFDRDDERFLINSDRKRFLNHDAVLEEITDNVNTSLEMKEI